MSRPRVWNVRDPDLPSGVVRVDRRTPFGNPFRLRNEGERTEVVERYRQWLWADAQEALRERAKAELAGHDLVCHCAPLACHAGVLLEVANGFRKTIAVDFDGVIHGYRQGWQGGTVYDEPVEGALAALRVLAGRYRVVVFTARDELTEVATWLRTQGLVQYVSEVTNRKPSAFAYVDDRAIRFQGWREALDEVAFYEEDEEIRRAS